MIIIITITLAVIRRFLLNQKFVTRANGIEISYERFRKIRKLLNFRNAYN